MKPSFEDRLQLYQITVILSVLFTLVGFSYNVWRLEVSEQNNTYRTASFEILLSLAELEQLIYVAHYDGDTQEGSPRKAWVQVGLVNDLSVLTTPAIQAKTAELKTIWSDNWQTITIDNQSVNQVIEAIDSVRAEIKIELNNLE